MDTDAPKPTAERDHAPCEFQVARVLQLLRDGGEPEKSWSILLECSTAPVEMAQSAESEAQLYGGGIGGYAETLQALGTFHTGRIA